MIKVKKTIFCYSVAVTSLLWWWGWGQPVTHMRSTNSNPQPSNQFPMDKIKPAQHLFLFEKPRKCHNRKENTVSCQLWLFFCKIVCTEYFDFWKVPLHWCVLAVNFHLCQESSSMGTCSDWLFQGLTARVVSFFNTLEWYQVEINGLLCLEYVHTQGMLRLEKISFRRNNLPKT